MKNKILHSLLVTALLLAVSAYAEPVKLKGAELPELLQALAALDGADKVVDQGKDAPARVVRLSYDFSGKVRFAIARDLATIRPAATALDETRTALIKQVSGGALEIKAEDKAKQAEFVRLWTDALSQPLTLDLTKFKEEDLKLDANAIPGTVLSSLAPLLDLKK